MKKRKKFSSNDLMMDIVIWAILILFAFVCLYPVWYVFVASISNSTELARNPGIMFWPSVVDTGAYGMVFDNPLLMNSMKNSVLILLFSLPINIVMTLLCAYFMACPGMMFKKPIVTLFMFTMFFSGGLIPGYLNIRSLNLVNSMWALILPSALSLYNAIICKTSMEAIPESLKESAYLDGANDIQIIFKIILPLIKATIAVLLLYYGVTHWNNWYSAAVYIRDNEKLPVQNILRHLLITNESIGGAEAGDNYNDYAESIKYAAIMVSTVPVLCIYPFLQKYFAKGALIGAVKG